MKTIKWFARGGDIVKAGPFDTQIKAVNSMRLITESDADYQKARLNFINDGWAGRDFRPQFKGGFPDNVFVWPEEVE
jgi:hypothetical protein